MADSAKRWLSPREYAALGQWRREWRQRLQKLLDETKEPEIQEDDNSTESERWQLPSD